MSTVVLHGDEVRQGLKAGVDSLANLVKITLGPKGMNVVMNVNGVPEIINDGVTIARRVVLSNPLHSMGANMIKGVSAATDDLSGDGTTTATILAQAILEAGIDAKNVNYLLLKREMDKYVIQIEKFLRSKSKKVKLKSSDLKNIALVSSNGDLEISKILVEAFTKVGYKGHVSINKPKGLHAVTELEIIKGIKYDSGYVSKFFVNDKETKTAKYINRECVVAYVSGELSRENEVVALMELAATDGLPLLIIAEKIFGEALSCLNKNRLQQGIEVCAVVCPGLKHDQVDIMADMISVTGGTILSLEDGEVSLFDATKEHFGVTNGFEVGQDYFMLKTDNVDQEKVDERIAFIKQEMKKYTRTVFQDHCEMRLGKLSGGVAVIYPQGGSDLEITERMLRIEDAKNSIQSALEEGYLPGGGVALYRAAQWLEDQNEVTGLSVEKVLSKGISEEKVLAKEILIKTLKVPFKQILTNSGYNDTTLLENRLKQETVFQIGFNALNDNFEDMYKAGIIDPVKIQVSALKNAVSVSATILSTGGAICEELPDPIQDKMNIPLFGGM